MPASDVTVTAQFVVGVAFTIQVPLDTTVTVSATGNTSISYSTDETVTFEVSDTSYNTGAANLEWLLNGQVITSATGSSVTIRARDCLLKTYTLTVRLKDTNNAWYSKTIDFTVIQ
jgi:hypothetical protein